MRNNKIDIEQPDGLGPALYFLHYMPNVRDETKYSQLKDMLVKDYPRNEIERIAKSLKWIKDNKSTSAKEILPNIKQSDEDIRYYIEKMCLLLKEYY